MDQQAPQIKVRLKEKSENILRVEPGITLREALLSHDCSPYRGQFVTMNCRGLGICGSCKVQVFEKDSWCERRSCQVRVYQDIEISLY